MPSTCSHTDHHPHDIEETPINIFTFGPVAGLLSAAYDTVLAVAQLIVPILGTPGFAVSIVCLVIVVRAAMIPLAVALARADAVRRRLTPDLAALRRRFAADPARLQRETAELYRREGASPFAGILPVLAQAPVLGLVYGLVTQPVIGGHANELMTHALGGSPLAASLLSTAGGAAVWPGLLVNLAVFATMLVIAELSRRRTLHRLSAEQLAAPPVPDVSSTASTARGIPVIDPHAVGRAMAWLSYLAALVSLVVPLAAAVYLAASALWTLIERQILMRRFGSTPGMLV